MQMPVIVGIVVAIIFLVAFSEWFYHMITGWKEIVLDDVYFHYRIAGLTLISILIMSGVFYGMAMVTECPNEVREGVFAKMNCKAYSDIVAGTENVMMRVENL